MATGNAIQSASSSGGGGSGTVTSVAAADTSVVIGGTPTVAPTVRTGTLDVIAAQHPPAADWSNNSHKITSLANGSAASDAAAFGQIPVVASAVNWPWLPADDGLLVANFDPAVAAGTAIMAAGTLYLLRLTIRQAVTISNLLVAVTTTGNNTGGSTGTFAGLYSSAGTLLTGSSDVAAGLVGSGWKTLALTTPQALSAATYVWAALLSNLGTTQATLAQTSINTTQWGNLGQAAGNFRFAVNGTGLTALPGSITPGNNTATGTHGFVIGAT